jgi:hypothetical protein
MPSRRTRHVEVAVAQTTAKMGVQDLIDNAAVPRDDVDTVALEAPLQLRGDAGADHLIDRKLDELLARLVAHHVVRLIGDHPELHIDDSIPSRDVEDRRDPTTAVGDRESHCMVVKQ